MSEYVNIVEAAKILKVSRPTVYQMIAEGRLTVYRKPAYKPKYSPVGIPREQVEALRPRQP